MPPLYRRPHCHHENESDAFREPMVEKQSFRLAEKEESSGTDAGTALPCHHRDFEEE